MSERRINKYLGTLIEDVRFGDLQEKLDQIQSMGGIPGPTGPQGEQGPKGDTGATGSVGVAAGFAAPEVDYSEIGEVGTPEASVTASGPNHEKLFRFTFKNLRGPAGPKPNMMQDVGTSHEDAMSQDAITKHLHTKVTKITDTSSNPRVYGVDETGAQVSYFATQTSNANTIPMRDASGRFQVADGVAPKQAINKSQLDSALEGVAKLSEQNTFAELNTFTETAQFDKGLQSDGDVSVTNSVIKVLDNSANSDGINRDFVAQYLADRIIAEENSSEYQLLFPKKSGTLATLDDISGTSLKFSEFKSAQSGSTKEDSWTILDDDASISIRHANGTSAAAINLSKNYVGMQAAETDTAGTTSSVIAFTPGAISIGVNDEGKSKSTVLILDDNGAKINSEKVLTATDIENKVDKLASSAVAEVYARDEEGNDVGIAYTYAAEGNTFAKRSASGTLAVETPTQPKDAANKEFVESKCSGIPVGVSISDIAGAVEGVITESDYATLTANANNYILKDGKKYERSSEREQADSLSYVFNGYLNNRQLQEVIEITVSAKSWVLKADNLLTDKTIANGKVGGVSIKDDFSDGLEISQTTGNLSLYGALDVDIKDRSSKRPILTTNLNKAVLAALTDDNKVLPSDSQKESFKAAWGINGSASAAKAVLLSNPASATTGVLTAEQLATLQESDENYIVFNNEYYRLADKQHTEGMLSYTHSGWNGDAIQDKSINITINTLGWVLVLGCARYYRHHIQLTVDTDKVIYYDFSSTEKDPYTAATLPVQPDTVTTTFALVYGGLYASVNGQVYRSGDDLKAIIHGVYPTSTTSFGYLSVLGGSCVFNDDVVTDM